MSLNQQMMKVLKSKTNRIMRMGTIAVVGGATLIYIFEKKTSRIEASDFVVHPMHLHWSHNGAIASLDMASVRRGYEVYKQVCAACHSMKFIRFRHFVNNFMSDAEAKAEAAEAQVDAIDDKGQPIKRPGVLNDYLPSPYPNIKAAAAANNGAAPPDLSLMAWAREDGDNYIFNLLTSYGFEPPAGITVDEGKAYNPYFPNGSVLAMPQQLFDEGIEYQDGTPATMSQQAKDVTTFLRWAAEQWHDTRKRWFLKVLAVTPLAMAIIFYYKKWTWTFIKSQKIYHRVVKGREWTQESSSPPPPKDAPPIKKIAG